MKGAPQKPTTVRRLLLAMTVAFLIQVPFLILMNSAGVHSALGGVWVVFYLPAILLLGKTKIPNISPFVATLMLALLQEFILLCIIIPVMVLFARLKSHNKNFT